MSERLAGKIALVTGAATGIGHAVAARFGVEGANVILFGLGGAELNIAARDCGGVAVEGDVTRGADIAAAIAACGDRLDIVVNAAGLIALDSPGRIDDDIWRRLFAVN